MGRNLGGGFQNQTNVGQQIKTQQVTEAINIVLDNYGVHLDERYRQCLTVMKNLGEGVGARSAPSLAEAVEFVEESNWARKVLLNNAGDYSTLYGFCMEPVSNRESDVPGERRIYMRVTRNGVETGDIVHELLHWVTHHKFRQLADVKSALYEGPTEWLTQQVMVNGQQRPAYRQAVGIVGDLVNRGVMTREQLYQAYFKGDFHGSAALSQLAKASYQSKI